MGEIFIFQVQFSDYFLICSSEIIPISANILITMMAFMLLLLLMSFSALAALFIFIFIFCMLTQKRSKLQNDYGSCAKVKCSFAHEKDTLLRQVW